MKLTQTPIMNLNKLHDTRILFLILMTITIFLRLINITSEQLWTDEAISIYIANLSLNNFWTKVINDVHPPLYYLILKGWIFMFGDSVFSCRLLSAIFSILTAPILYLIGKEIKDEKFGLIIMIFYSISPFSIFYANEVRSYSLLHLLFTIALFFAIKCTKTPNITKNFAFFGISGVFLIYTHYVGIIYIGVLCFGIFIFNRKEKLSYRNISISILILILSYTPWLLYAIEDAFGGPHGYTGGRLSLINLIYYAFNYFLAPVPSNINDPYIFNLVILTFIINLPLVIILIISLIGFFYSYKAFKNLELKNTILFILLILFLMFGISIILGIIIPNSFKASNLIGGLSLVFIIQGFGIYYLFFDKSMNFKTISIKFKYLNILNPLILKKIAYFLFFILLFSNLVIYPIIRATYLQKPDWDGCVKKIKKNFKKNDILIFNYEGQIPYVMEYYSDLNNFDLSEKSYELTYKEDDIEEFFEYISDEKITRIWIIYYWSHLRDPDDLTEEMVIDEYDLEEIDQYNFRRNITVILYEVPNH